LAPGEDVAPGTGSDGPRFEEQIAGIGTVPMSALPENAALDTLQAFLRSEIGKWGAACVERATPERNERVMSKIVERTLDLLELFAQEMRPLSLSDVARLMSIPMSSCHDVLHTMQARGYIYEVAPRAGYYPTVRFRNLGRRIAEHDPVLLRAEQLLRSMRDTLDESVLLAKVSGLQAIYLLTFEPSHPLRVLREVGEVVRTLHSTSAGKALLGSLDDRAFAAFLKSAKLEALTKKTIVSKAALSDDIEVGRRRGWYLNQSESHEGVTTVSVPFSWNSVTYIVTVAGPSCRVDSRLDDVIGLMTKVCLLLSMRSDEAHALERVPIKLTVP
jgi:DNA-binding IclR family transcriptional regulator